MGICRRAAVAVVVALTLLGAPPPLHAADLRDVLTDYTLTSWGQKDGLPPGAVWSMAQDADGYLWIGTDAGLFRFDGVRFVRWTPFGSANLPQLPVRTVHISRDGRVWAGHGESGGISMIQRGQARTYGEADGLPHTSVSVIVENGRGALWAGNSQGLFSFGGDRWIKLPRSQGLPESPIFGAYVSKADDLVVATGAGIYRQPAGTDHFSRVEASYDGVPRSLAEDSAGRLLVVDSIVGVRRISGGSPGPAGATARGRGYRLLRDRGGNLWVGTLGQGLWRFSAQSEESRIERATALTGLASDGVISLMEDRGGNLWAGTSEGLSRLVPRKITQITDLGLVTGVEVNRDGSVWVGTVDGVVRFSESNLHAPVDRLDLGAARLRTMHASRDTLWAATDKSVRFHSGQGSGLATLSAGEPLNQVDRLTTDSFGNLWMYDAHRRLLKWSHGAVETVALPAPLQGRRIGELYGDESGRVWMGLDRGNVGYLSDGAAKVFTAVDGYAAGACRALFEDRDGVIWIAGSSGLARFVDGRFESLTRTTGFPLENLTALIDDDARNLWIGSGMGILRIGRGEFDKALASREYRLQYTLYDRNDGIAGTPLASYSTGRPVTRAGDGRLWFVTGGGLTVIDPRAMSGSESFSPVRIEQVVANETRMAADPSATLAARTSRLEIDYTVVNLTSPFRTNFRYRLDGFDTDWIDAGTRHQAFYTNLPPRSYRFSLIASNSEGAPLSSVTWDFSIRPMFYQTQWFYTLTATALILSLWGAWHLRLRWMRREFALLLGERTRLGREIHDTLLQSLVGVALQFDAIAGDVEASSPATRAQFVRMRKRVEEYIREARQSIWNLRSPTLERRDLIAALRQFGEEAAATAAVGFDLTVDGTPRQRAPKIEDQLLRIGQEAITNAIRHARPSQINVRVTYGDDALVLRVSDDGFGFDPDTSREEAAGHYGLVSMKERAAVAGGTLRVASSNSAGTQVSVVVPVARRSFEPSHADG